MNRTILIVDDEPAIREALRRALRHEPLRVLDAESGAAALDLLGREPVDLMLSDHNMPGQSGLALCEEARRRHPGLVCILMTGASDGKLAAEAVEREAAYHCLQKPWEPRELSLLLRLALRHQADVGELARLRQLVKAQRRIIAELEQGAAPAAPIDRPPAGG